MTTVATDGVTIAADGLLTWGGRRLKLDEQKLRRLPDGSVVGWAGNADEAVIAVEALARDDGDEAKGDYSLLRLFPDGKLAVYVDRLIPTFTSPPQAIGSGGDVALGAMLAGMSAKQAVRAAARIDTSTGGTIRSRKVRR